MKYFLFPKLGPWYMAQARIAVVHFVTIPLAVQTEFWNTWAAVYRSPR